MYRRLGRSRWRSVLSAAAATILGLLSGLGDRFPLLGRWAPGLVEALRDLQLLLVLGE